MIKSLSPYYLEVPLVAPLSLEVCTSFTLQIFVWDGLKNDPPADPIYEITKDNPTGSSATEEINIALLVNDYIDFVPNVSATTELVDGLNQRWVKTQILYTTTEPTDYVPNYVQTLLMTQGYGYGLQGKNTQLPTNNILLQGTEFKVSRTGKFVLPILIEEPVLFVEILSYTTNSGTSTSSDIDIIYGITDLSPTDVVVQISADDVTFTDQETLPNVSPLENVIITFPLGDNTYVRLKVTEAGTDYFSNSIDIGVV